MNCMKIMASILLAALMALPCKAEKYVPLDLEHFSQEMLDYLPKYPLIKKYFKTFTREDGTTYQAVDVEAVTSMTAQLPLDSRGVNQFVNVSELTFSSRAKFIDIRGMKKISRLTNVNFKKGSVSAGANDNIAYWETVLADSTALITFDLPQCINLRFLSLTGCSELTEVNVPGCDIMGLDLSSSSKLKKVNVQDNPNLSVLRLPKVAKDLTQLHLCHTNLQELVLPDDWGHVVNPWNQDVNARLTLNVDNTHLRSINLFDLHPKTYFEVIKLNNTKLTAVELGHIMDFGSSSDTKLTNNVYVGHVDSYKIVDPVAHATAGGNNQLSSISVTSGGTFDKETGVFTFDEGVTEATYTYRGITTKPKVIDMNVTLTRSLKAPDLYLEFDEDNPTLDECYERYMGSELLSHVDENGKNVYNRIKFKYDGDNHYSLPLDHLVGNFHFVLSDEDGESVVGAHIADLTSHYAHWKTGRILASPNVKTEGESRASSEPRKYSLHREQPAGTKKLHTRTKNTKYQKSDPYTFTTHADEFQNNVGRLDDVVINVHYIKNDPTSYVQFASNEDVSSIESIEKDGVSTEVSDPGAPVEYYTLQGIRVGGDTLVPGIYIRRQGAKAKKVMVR